MRIEESFIERVDGGHLESVGSDAYSLTARLPATNNLTIQRDSMYEPTSMQSVSLGTQHFLHVNVILTFIYILGSSLNHCQCKTRGIVEAGVQRNLR